jgi:hypothetical protein
MIFNTPAPEDIVRWYRKGVPGGGQKDRIFDRLKAKLTGGTDDSGTSYFSMLEKKLSPQDADIIIKNMKTDIDGYPMLETGSTSGQDERRYQEWIVERYLQKESFTEGFTDTTVAEEKKEEVAEEEAEEIVEKAEEEVKENIDEAVKVVDKVVVDKPVVEETAPDLSDIVDLLPPGMLDAVNQQTGQNYEKTPKEKKQKEESVSNSKILKTLTSSLEKIQGQLSSIDNELKKQNELFGAAVGTTVSNLNQIETTYDSLNDRFDDILNAMQSQNDAEKEKEEAAELATSEANMEGQEEVADTFGFEDLTDEIEKKDKDKGGFDFGKMFDRFRKFKKRFSRGRGGPKGGGPKPLGGTGAATATGTGGAVATGTGGGTLATGGGATATGVTGLTAAGIVGSVGLALGAVGESGFMGGKKLSEDANRIKEIGQKMSDDGNPLGSLIGGMGNFSLAQGETLKKIGTFADVGFAPFRLLASLPLQALGIEKLPGQEDSIRHNDAKFDSRIREDARSWMNKVDFMNIIPDEVGGFGNIYNDENAHKEMMQKFELGGSGTGVPELHGTEALIGPGFYKDLMSPVGGTILAASSKVLSDVGPLAATVAPSFQQEASKIATAFDVPKSLASTNVGGSIDGVSNAINKNSKKAEEATYDSRAVEGMSGEADDDKEDKGPLGLLKNAFKGLRSLFGGGGYDGDLDSLDFTDVEDGNTDDLRFGLTGTTGMSQGGWSHAHFEAQDQNQATLIKDTTPVVKKMISKGMEPETSDGRPFTEDMSNREIAELIKHGADRHNHSGPKPYAVDINMPGFPKVPVQLEDVRNTPMKGEGVNALIKGTKTAIFHLSFKSNGYEDGGIVGESGEEQITVGEAGPEVVMKNLVYGVPPVLDHLMAMNDAGTSSELIQTYRTFAPEVLAYDEEAESMAQTIIVMTPPSAPPAPTMDIPRDKSVTRPPMGVAPGKAAMHIALFN